jgi:hypothetical protein
MKNKWIDVEEFLVVKELNTLRSNEVLQQIWHENWLKVQEIGVEEYLKQFEDEK